MESAQQKAMAMAIEVMTAMFAEPEDKGFAMGRVQKISDEGGRAALGLLCGGLITLAGSALVELSGQMQVPELELLRRLALNVQREG